MARLYLRQSKISIVDQTGFGRDFSGLRVKYRIEKTITSGANGAKFQIYNLNEDSRRFLEQKKLKIVFAVGYADQDLKSNLFVGDITKAVSEKKTPDWITDVEAGDAQRALQDSVVDKSYGPGTPFTAIITDVLKSFGVTTGPQQPVGAGIALNGFTVTGKAKDILDKLAKRFGFDWSVQDDAIQVTNGALATTETAIVVSQTTGLIENVIKKEDGIEFKHLIDPGFRPGRGVSVITDSLKGFFKVTKATFDGDTHEGKSLVHVEAIPIG